MIAIPITMGILVIGALIMQYEYHCQSERLKAAEKIVAEASETEHLRKEFNDYKKRVDALAIKVGFHL